jgi:hypothetical protein
VNQFGADRSFGVFHGGSTLYDESSPERRCVVTILPTLMFKCSDLTSDRSSLKMIKPRLLATIASAALFGAVHSASGSGLATCDSGDPSSWKTEDQLKAQLVTEGYEVRRIKIDGGCYEAYVIDASGEMTERYYNPVDLTFIPTND